LIIIEHNLDLIRAADWVIDLGPGAGEQGGRIVAQGTPETLKTMPESYTGQALAAYEADIVPSADTTKHSLTTLSNKPKHELTDAAVTASKPGMRRAYQENSQVHQRVKNQHAIEILNAREHNLKGIDVTIPRDK
ncbi:hypothetical protein QP445_12465, partial [Micrococcus luteus]|nr:hypothetical protein [Micrococcus luteus]